VTLKQKIIKLVRLSTTESIRDMSFSFFCISIGTRSLIRIKYVSKLAEYFGQLFISILTPTGFCVKIAEGRLNFYFSFPFLFLFLFSIYFLFLELGLGLSDKDHAVT